MQRRIAIWAVAGVVVACGWTLAVMLTGPWPAQHMIWKVLEITYPVSLLRAHPLTFYECLVINTATYALFGLGIELLRRSSSTRLSH